MHYRATLWILAVCLCALIITRDWWQAGMARHMAGQIPLLTILGALLGVILRQRVARLDAIARQYRISLLLFSLFVFGLWMLPRLLDAALHDSDVAFGKWLSLPLAGMALVLCWRHLPFVLRGVLHLEALATLLRLGWLYLMAPLRYCVSYGLDEQQLLGYVLLTYGAVYAAYLAWRVMFGRVQPAALLQTPG